MTRLDHGRTLEHCGVQDEEMLGLALANRGGGTEGMESDGRGGPDAEFFIESEGRERDRGDDGDAESRERPGSSGDGEGGSGKLYEEDLFWDTKPPSTTLEG